MFNAYALASVNKGRERAIVLRSQIALTSPGHEKRTGWTQIAKVGEWSGHPSGRFELTRKHFAEAIKVFEAQETPPPFDYEHSTEFGTPSGKAIASGWIHKVELRGDQLWALVEWTEDAAKHIRAGEYRFTSAVFLLDSPDRESGKPLLCRLKSAALTNVPFMDGLHAVTLSERELTSASAGKVRDMTDQATPVANAEEMGASPEAAIAARLIEATGMSTEDLSAAIEANLDAILAALKGGAEAEEEAPAADEIAATDQVKALSEKVAAYEKREREALIADVDALIASKRVDASLRPSLVALSQSAPDMLRADISKLRAAPAPATYPQGRQASAIVANASAPSEDPQVLSLSQKFRDGGVADENVIRKFVAAQLARNGG